MKRGPRRRRLAALMGLIVIAAAGWVMGAVAPGHTARGPIADDAAWTR
jgi:hypothetical protein